MEIIVPSTPEDFRSYFKARWQILREPLGFPKGSEIDNQENISFHVMAMENDEVLGVGRLTYFPDGNGQIRYMGVKNSDRNMKIGSKILSTLEDEGKRMGVKNLFLNAREEALNFYLKNGYQAAGEPFQGLAEIPHTKMTKSL